MSLLDDRRGMTMLELLVVTVLGMMILGGIYQVLVTNQRTYTAQNVMVRNQQSLRGGIDVLLGELREISPADGDLVNMASSSITIRASRSLGIVCGIVTVGSNPVVQARVVGSYLKGGEARVFFENSPRVMGDDVWRTASVDVQDSTGTITCLSDLTATAQSVQLQGVSFGSSASGDSITLGAPIRNVEELTYRLGTFDGQPYLTQVDSTGTESPLAGPLRAQDGLAFRYFDVDGNVTATPTAVREIEVTARTSTVNASVSGGSLEDSLRIRIHTRN